MSNATEMVHLASWKMNDYLPIIVISTFMLSVALLKVFYIHFSIISNRIPESCLLFFFGLIFGLFGKLFFHEIVKQFNLTPNVFFLMLLPPIILESSYCLYTKTFAHVIWIILIFAIFGTLFCFLIIGFSLYLLKELGVFGNPPIRLTLKPILLFSSLIVAVDPVAVIAIFQDIGVDLELYFIVFGESLFNDAVTVVLYDIINSFMKNDEVSTVQMIIGVSSFATVSIGGLIIGIVLGVVSCIFVRAESRYQYLILVIFSYISYIIALGVAWSGIISMISCGVLQARYAFNNMTSESVIMLRHVTESLASISEAMIFFYLGNALTQRTLKWHSGFTVWALALCIISRFLVTIALSSFINFFNINYRYITLTEQFVLFYGGLRGAVSFSLCVLIEGDVLDGTTVAEKEESRDILFTTTMFIILFTVCIMGSTMKPLMKLLDIKLNNTDEKSKFVFVNLTIKSLEFANDGVSSIVKNFRKKRWIIFLEEIDEKYIAPFLGGKKKDLSILEVDWLSKMDLYGYSIFLPVSMKPFSTSRRSSIAEKDYFIRSKSIQIRNPREFAISMKNRETVHMLNRSKVLQSLNKSGNVFSAAMTPQSKDEQELSGSIRDSFDTQELVYTSKKKIVQER